MPVINGQVQRSRFTSLKLRELSSVDNPAQPGALMAIMKRHEGPRQMSAQDLDLVAKYICESDGAHSFSQVLIDNEFSQKIWPYTDALTQSIRSIVGDKSLSGGDREQKIGKSVSEFLAAVRSISPETAKSLELIVRKEREMPKSIEELTKEVGDLTGQLTSANALAASEKVRADNAEKGMAEAKDKLKEEEEAHKATKVKLSEATEETIKFGGEEVKKSEVGDAQFKVVKAMADTALMATLEKRASTEFGHVTGTETEKALVLKMIEGKDKDDPARKALEAIMTAHEKMVKGGFDRLGTTGGQTETAKAAEQKFTEKVAEIQKRDECSQADAMEKARLEAPDLFAAYQNGGADTVPAN